MSVSPPCHFLCPRDSSIPFIMQSAAEAEEGDTTKKEEPFPNQGSYLMISRNCVDCGSALLGQVSLANFLSFIAAGVCLPWNIICIWDLLLFRARDVIRLKRERDFPVSWNLLRPMQQLLRLCIVNLGHETVVTVLNVATKNEQLQEKRNSVFWKKVRLI